MPSKLDKFYARQCEDGDYYIFYEEKWEAIFTFSLCSKDKILHCGNVRSRMRDEFLNLKEVYEKHFKNVEKSDYDDSFKSFIKELEEYIYGEKPKYKLTQRKVYVHEVEDQNGKVVSIPFLSKKEAEAALAALK